MTGKRSGWSDLAWRWVLKIGGATVFGYAVYVDATSENSVSPMLAFIGIAIAVLPLEAVAELLKGWRRPGSGNGKEQ